jgi:putative ABC transport system substrate-binding protein
VPKAAALSVLLKPNHPSAKAVTAILKQTARTLGVEVDIKEASSDPEIEAAYATLKPGSALLVATDPFFFVRRARLVALAAEHKVLAIYDNREFAESGGLLSYGTIIAELWQQAGTSVARILKGEKPANLPVTQPTRFELVLNMKTAKTLGLDVPPNLLATADEVIE